MEDKIISELDYVGSSGYTLNDLLVLVNYDIPEGTTKNTKITDIQNYVLESFTGSTGGVISLTYSELVDKITNSLLIPGRFYLMTDYQTCYDQPNYDNTKNPITTGNYMTGNTEPILLLSISTTDFSPTVYSTTHPQDHITYDITWDTTEITSSPAKGRITERIDQYNNRTDYDHRTILFKRYRGYSYNENNPLAGLIGISGITGTTGILYGNTGTTFNSNISSGSIIAIPNLNPAFFEVISVESDSISIISGVTISGTDNAPYYSASNDGIMSYYQPNIRQNQVYEYTTFGDAIDDGAVNNYIGNYSNLHLEFGTGDFLLANNVFLDGSFRNNTIGNGSYNNTFNDDCDNNQIGDGFYNNSTNDDFDGNIIGENFRNNYITAEFNYNRIGSDFYSNTLLGSDFYRNNIGNNFRDNVYTSGDFQNNEIGNQFNNNKIYDDFYNNDIGNGYNQNEIYSEFYRNLIGNGYNGNTIYLDFYENNIEHVFYGNTVGTNLTIGSHNFSGNKIGSYFENNIIKTNFENNNILNNFESNTITGNTFDNTIGNNFTTNTIGNNFAYNQIGNNFQFNTIDDDFGFGGSSQRGNKIGNGFSSNNVGEYFYDNILPDNFQNNTIGDYFQWNVIDTDINLVDFTPNYGNITAFTYNALGTGSTDGIYTNLTGTTNGHGVNASFNIEVSGNTVIGVSGNSGSKLYQTGNTITILGSQIGGVSGEINGFSINNKLSVKIYKPADSTYTYPSNETEMDYLINNSPLFDTYDSPNIQGVSYSTQTGVDQGDYGMVIEGYINIPSNNTYYFGLSSDDGSDAFINGIKVADWYGAHGDSGNLPSGNQYPITLTGGTYPIKVRMQERSGGDIVILLYSSDSGSTWNIIPNNWFVSSVTGVTGSYPNIFAQGTGGENATFDVEVVDGLVNSVVLNQGGTGYTVGEILTITGSVFGGTEDISITVDSVYSNNVIVTVTGVSPKPSVYEQYTCQIFKNSSLTNRLSYYDESDVLTIKNINE
jgi:hypothetical protein